MSQRPATDNPGAFYLGRYRVVDEIGVGGMASVHLAKIDGPGGFQKWAAIKQIHAHLIEDESVIQMFLDEARVAASISHPNVATVFELGKDDESYWIAMEYLHGEPLRELMRRSDELGQNVPPEIACKIVADAAEGLHAAHELTGKNGENLNLVHRDVTPHNLFVTYDGVTKVVDFGIAKFNSRMSSSTRAGTLKGKLAYMAPEQVAGESVDRRSDIFALGVVLWELTTGQRLFRMDSDLDTLAKVQECNVPKPSSIVRGYPMDLEKVVMKALVKNRGERYRTAREFSRALQSFFLRRGLFVASDEVSAYMQSVFQERMAKRDAHLRWATEMTQTGESGVSPNKVSGVGPIKQQAPPPQQPAADWKPLPAAGQPAEARGLSDRSPAMGNGSGESFAATKSDVVATPHVAKKRVPTMYGLGEKEAPVQQPQPKPGQFRLGASERPTAPFEPPSPSSSTSSDAFAVVASSETLPTADDEDNDSTIVEPAPFGENADEQTLGNGMSPFAGQGQPFVAHRTTPLQQSGYNPQAFGGEEPEGPTQGFAQPFPMPPYPGPSGHPSNQPYDPYASFPHLNTGSGSHSPGFRPSGDQRTVTAQSISARRRKGLLVGAAALAFLAVVASVGILVVISKVEARDDDFAPPKEGSVTSTKGPFALTRAAFTAALTNAKVETAPTSVPAVADIPTAQVSATPPEPAATVVATATAQPTAAPEPTVKAATTAAASKPSATAKTPAFTPVQPPAPATPVSGTAQLGVVCIPSCTQIVIDGTSVGPGPVFGRSVSAGKHTIKMVGPGGAKSVSVDLKPDSTKTIRQSIPQ